jgi:Zn-dependent protease with chaperone function
MDQEVIDGARQAVEGLLVLAAIPVVLYALWAEYFAHYLEDLKENNPDFDRKAEMEKAKTASICVLLFEIVLFIGSIDLLKIYPKTCALVLLGATFSLGAVQAGLEKKLRIPQALLKAVPGMPPAPLGRGQNINPLKALFFGLLGGFSYMITMITVVKVFAWIAEISKMSNSGGAVFVMVGAAFGIFAGLLLNFALGPWQMKNSLPVSKLPEGELLEKISNVFSKANRFDFFIVEVEAPRTATAMVAGFSIGRGPFRPAVFISRSLLNQLTDGELCAVIAHEAAHIDRSHLAKRLAFSGVLIVGLTFLAVFGILAVHFFFPVGDWQGSTGSVFGFMALLTTFRALSWQSRRHEIEADVICTKSFSRFEEWASALRKIDAFNGVTPAQARAPSLIKGLFGQGHLATEIRIAQVKNLIGYSDQTSVSSEDQAQESDRAA